MQIQKRKFRITLYNSYSKLENYMRKGRYILHAAVMSILLQFLICLYRKVNAVMHMQNIVTYVRWTYF